MSATMEKLFNLPDLGEGLTESEILSWRVAVGDTVQLNQIIAEVETAKAVVELPSPFSGVVTKVFEPVGAVVNVGNPIISFEVPAPAGAPTDRQPTLVGYGAAVESTGRPARRGRAILAEPAAKQPAARQQEAVPVAATQALAEIDEQVVQPQQQGIGYLRARPPVRKLARDLHVDLRGVHPSGAGGLITREDVLQAKPPATEISAETQVPASAIGHPYGAPVVEAIAAQTPRESRERRVQVHGVRKTTAKAIVASAFSAPHVSEFLSVDVTESMELLERLRQTPHLKGVKLTITTLVAKAVSMILARHQGMNSRWDAQSGEIIEFHYVNLGIAAATDRGLMVPVVHEAQNLNLEAMAREISELTRAAREGTISPAQLSGGTFSISNIGVFGIDAGTPILPPGQTGILALGQVRKMPWEFRDEVALRQVMTLSLSFDHRVVDGEQGAKFLVELGMLLNDPGMLFGVA
ncbi:dihydrolipoamide acetyltransferase family protein [Paeniglutamicibacter kerguelensis]|uniref:Dihydrolipoamide acetyltransferase component of pyruvate dehydrogenase complex n=1 Tax=Paeniglutamicibacter kerguelensis TaxID=254788 RepID=A0ABS4X9G3_9MICC|nr:dihydrolipoamide acetyltransferase family protein [Paeniglutamicibacter kerguelensis]MBP2385112.1 pyruvate dehydrogenase E2 component (dihydrolipoamide acetyltransferase) [Paeniglutamicibacter kerguelensis]